MHRSDDGGECGGDDSLALLLLTCGLNEDDPGDSTQPLLEQPESELES